MQYDCIETLPDSVKAALDEKGQKMWMDAFNSIVKKSENKRINYRDAVFEAWKMMKSYQGCRFFSGFVSTEDLDRQNDVVSVDKAYDKIKNHIDRGGTMVDTHTNRTVGSFIYAEKAMNKTGKPGVRAYSVIYQGEPYYNTVWEQIKRGIDCPTCGDVRKGYSIGGFALDAKNKCDAFGCHREILDMSIHEISVCQDPANPEAIIQEVNMMAKSESGTEDKPNEINKALRADAPAVEANIASPGVMETQDVATHVAEQQKQDDKQQMMQNLDIKTVMNWVKDNHKKVEDWRKFLEMMRGLTDPNVSVGISKAIEELERLEKVQGMGSQSCGCFEDDLHTSVTSDKCPTPKELYGDVNDAQVRNTMENLENKNIEADESAKKETKKDKLMPTKDEVHEKGFEKGQNAEVNKEGENTSVEKKVEPLKGTDDVSISSKNMDEPGSETKAEVPKTKVDQTMPTSPKTETKTISDDGSPREKNMGKEGKELMMKCPGDGKAEIPEELMPLFREFLQEKGIKLQPEVESKEIEGPLEKTLYVDDDISELDLKELSNPVEFDSSAAMGKSATQRLKIHNMMARLRLAKSLKVADIEFLVSDMDKAGEGPMPEMPEDVPKQSTYLTPRQRNKMARKVEARTAELFGRPTESNVQIARQQHMPVKGRAEEIVEAVKGTCPKCGEFSLYKFGNFEGCERCGYHNVPHSGTPQKKI